MNPAAESAAKVLRISKRKVGVKHNLIIVILSRIIIVKGDHCSMSTIRYTLDLNKAKIKLHSG